MDEIRYKRYKDKINYIVDCIKDLPITPKNKFEKMGIFYLIQTSIESMIDLVAMIVKDLGIQVKDDTTNISELVEKRKINIKLANTLNKANGLRNILVHRYNGVDEQIILESVEDVKKLLYEWLDIIEEILNEIRSD